MDVSAVDDFELAEAIRERLRADIRVANFGDQWMAEEQVPRFSRGDLRRIKDYIQEQEQPLTDDVLVQDVLMVRPNSPDFELMRFAVNFRLSREHRDFDFVGTTNQRFWSTSSLPQIGTTRRKPNEIGTDFRYLVEETSGGRRLPVGEVGRSHRDLLRVLPRASAVRRRDAEAPAGAVAARSAVGGVDIRNPAVLHDLPGRAALPDAEPGRVHPGPG